MVKTTHCSLHSLKIGVAFLAAGVAFGTAAYAQAPADPTPRTADGHPDLSGVYVGGGGLPSGADNVTFAGRGGNFFGFEEDNGLNRLADMNKPIYKPEYWETIKNNDYMGNWEDPLHQCNPTGVPGMGMPAQIVAVAGQPAIILIYQSGFNGYGGRYNPFNQFRWVWTDGREHNPAEVVQESWNGGSAVGHWDGDTLVVETIGFTDASWLHKSGYIHGFDMKVTERFTRDGNKLTWAATVEDPEFLQRPWELTPQSRNLNPDPDAFIPADLPCRDVDASHLTSHVRSG